MKRVFRWHSLLILVACLATLAGSVSATTFVIPADDDMIIQARAIVRGKVIAVETGLDEQQGPVFTYVTLKVQEVLKGQVAEREIVIKEPGGEFGTKGTVVFGTAQFAVGEKVLVYLDTWRDGSLRVHDMQLGKFAVTKDPQTGELIVVRNIPDSSVQVLGQSSRGPITNRMKLSTYTEMVRVRFEANSRASQDFEAQAYQNVPVLSRPAGYVERSQAGDFQPQFHIWAPPTRWFEPDTGGTVVFKVNPDQAPSAQVESDVAAACNTWSTVAGCAIRVAEGGTTSGSGLFVLDGENTIYFNNADGYFSGSGTCGASILAVTSIANYDRSQTIVVNGTTFYKALESNMTFNPFASCYFSDHCVLQEITTHEMGHGLGLRHSWDSGFGGSPTPSDQIATMFWVIHADGRCAGLKTDDTNGITFIYPGSGGGGPLSIVTSSLAGGTVGAAYSQPLSASGGTSPYSWSLAAGSTPLPTGLSLSTAGVISGTPSTAGTFSFTVKVTDGAAATAQKALSIVVSNPGTAYNSQFVSQQNVPTSVSPGQQFTATLSWLNNGTQTWDGSNGFSIRSQNPAGNTTWGGNQVNLVGSAWAPGQTMSVSVTFTAPSTAGTYNFQWQTYQSGTGYFGQTSTNVSIQVGSGGGGGSDNAAFVTQNVPTTMTVGQMYSVSVTMQNTGTTTWAAATYKLGSQNPQDNTTWGFNRVSLASSVAPGSSATFTFNVTAPGVAGTYNFQWQMFNGTAFFGSASTNVAVAVSGGGGGGGGGGPYDAVFVSQSVPASMNPGQSYGVSVTFRNAGTQTWSATGGISLSSQNAAGNTTWGLNRINLNKSIPSGTQWSFTFTVVAPTTPGTYNFQWQLMRDGQGYFGAPSTNVPVRVGGSGGGTDGAGFISQSVSTSMTAGQTVGVSVTMSNTGTTTWQPGTYLLGSLNPAGNSTWGLSQVGLGSSVAPSGSATFNFNITAPTTPGSYNFQWGMKKGSTYFGTASTNVVVTVTGGGGGGGSNNASFVSQTVPSSMTPGQVASVSVTMNNNGTTTWSPGTFSLVSRNPSGNTVWGLSSVALGSSVGPGSNVTFTFNITAPSVAGTYNFQWQMEQSGLAFGAMSTNVAVVVGSGSAQPPVITTTSLPYGTKGVFYNQQINVSGGAAPFSWSVSSGALPPGLTLKNGVISGTPSVSGPYSFTVTVRDANGATASQFYKTAIK